MHFVSRRNLLKLAAFVPALPSLLSQRASAEESGSGNVLVVVRMAGGHDGLNAVVPFRDDAYYLARPTIAIPPEQVIRVAGADIGLHPALADFQRLMEDGYAAVVQNVGYADSSREHARAMEIWETGSTASTAPVEGWLGRYLDQVANRSSLDGVEFGDSLGRTLVSKSRACNSIGSPELLLRLDPARPALGHTVNPAMQRIQIAQNRLCDTTDQLRRASKGSGGQFAYPDTAFGESLRWTGNMIESGATTRVFCVTLGSFDTHVDQLAVQHSLLTEFAKGLRAFAEHLRKSGQLDRVQLITVSEFGRQLVENPQGGTEHGDASVVFAMGGKVRAGVHGSAPDLMSTRDGGVVAQIDFRQLYANLLERWFDVNPHMILDESRMPFALLA